ncbi:hypothetical protein J5O04_12405 [Corynebacterium hindlerae]|uniref:hypothetical protein n=1 Tax=Corynebacterium hindlerae TaxID=699041 RepID=UPI001AD6837D|nr:hypothetical protein [Corynebacterium hindlerae]QTH59559.1 hypothetical protein J5O04_12405 [Corynebacterium hindlerae]
MTEVQRSNAPVTVVLEDAPARPAVATATDVWLNYPTSEITSRKISNRLRESMSLPALWGRRIRTFGSTTIGMMTLITMVLTVAILAAGVSMAQSTESRQTALTTLINNTEPMSSTAQDLYTSLSLAETIATTGFVQAGVELPENRERYQRAIQRASAAATKATAGLGPQPSRELELITQIQTQLPVYTGLVETARSNNRMGNPVGAAYLAQASSLMRLTILPAARELLDRSNGTLNEKQRSLTEPQWVPISGLVAALIMLYWAQRWLALRTRRRLNKGFLTATTFMAIALLWVTISNGYTWYSGSKGYQEAAAPLSALTNARVLSQQARTGETLALVRRETSAQTIEGFDVIMMKVQAELNHYQDSSLSNHDDNAAEANTVETALQDWQASHERLRRAVDQGEYGEASTIAFHSPDRKTPEHDGTTAEYFDTVDSGLARLIQDARLSLRTYLDSGLMATRWVSTLVLILSIASVAALWLGIRPRLQEYL